MKSRIPIGMSMYVCILVYRYIISLTQWRTRLVHVRNSELSPPKTYFRTRLFVLSTLQYSQPCMETYCTCPHISTHHVCSLGMLHVLICMDFLSWNFDSIPTKHQPEKCYFCYSKETSPTSGRASEATVVPLSNSFLGAQNSHFWLSEPLLVTLDEHLLCSW